MKKKKLSIVIVSLLLMLGVYGCQSKKESMNYETVIKDVIMYSQDNLIAMEGKTPEEVLKMYEEADKDIDERFSQTFTKEALNDLKIKDITNIQEKLSHYTLPIEISKIIVKEDTTSTVTVQFIDHQKSMVKWFLEFKIQTMK